MRIPLVVLAVTLAGAGSLRGQSNPLSSDAKGDYRMVRDYILRTAEKMPAANYDFKPSPDVRTFGQIIAHIADDEYNLCSKAKGETRKAEYTEIEQTVSGKANLVAALKQAFAYCDGIYDLLTDASAMERLPPGKGRQTKVGQLYLNIWHTFDHYGNLVVYLRLKGLVPPSSDMTR